MQKYSFLIRGFKASALLCVSFAFSTVLLVFPPLATAQDKGKQAPQVRKVVTGKSFSKKKKIRLTRRQRMNLRLKKRRLRRGDPIFIRIFKQEGELELWMRAGKRFTHVKTYRICKSSGHIGPKLRERDYQSPEGFYSVGRAQMKPDSAYHRAFNLGFPNQYDKAWGRTGSLLMVHGACKSVGCFAMTNSGIDEIYNLADAALRKSQKKFWVHSFPFRLSAVNMDKHHKHRWNAYWWDLKEGYDLFEQTLLPPIVSNRGRNYVFSPAPEPQIIKRAGATGNLAMASFAKKAKRRSKRWLRNKKKRFNRKNKPTLASSETGDPFAWKKF